MKQEPVASSIWDSQRISYEKCGCDICKKKHTAPRELSDEEILFIYAECPSDICSSGVDPLKFARAILKKASEK